ncbi:beta strand repeat-containing protein, partial [Marinomonas sp. IMCC 4694]|uniref:beta strand repeat-containing protein n=1 Tax=Marinomonas sp. IMCC 4694 TaxID=2605432 RepID=UPI001652E370
ANVNSSAGHISLNAAQDVLLNAMLTTTGITKTVDVLAARNITMVDGSSISTLGGDVRLDAVNNINLSLINVGSGDVALTSTAGQVLDNQTSVASTNVIANGLSVNAHNGMGNSSNTLETTVTTWALNSDNGSVFVRDTTSVATGTVTVDVNTINNNGVASNTQSTLTGVTTAAGNIVLNAKDDLSVVATVSSIGGTITLDAEAGALTMVGSATVTATNSSARLNAATNLTIGNVVAKNVSLVADTGNIMNAAGSTMNVTATHLDLNAGSAVGSARSNVTTQVDTLSAVSGTGVFITEADRITVNSVTIGTTGDLQITANSIVLGNVKAANVSLTATKGDIAFNQINAATQATLIASGKLLAVVDDSVNTNLITPTFNVSSTGFYLDIENRGFVEALAEVSEDMITVRADVIIDKGIVGESIRVTKDNRSYIVTNNTQENTYYAQFYSQNQNAQYAQLVDDTLTEEQFIQSLNAPREVNNLNEVFEANLLENSLLNRLQSNGDATSQGEVDDYVYITRGVIGDTASKSGVQNSVQTQTKTQAEQQLETSILRIAGQGPRVNDGLSFETGVNQSRANLSPVQSLMSDLVNRYGNRQIDVLGNTTSDYLFFYSIDENDEESILESIL